MSKFIILAAFAVGASLGLTAGIDTLKPARIIKIYERDAPTTTPNNVVVFSANEDDAAARCVDVFLRNDGSYGFDEFHGGGRAGMDADAAGLLLPR